MVLIKKKYRYLPAIGSAFLFISLFTANFSSYGKSPLKINKISQENRNFLQRLNNALVEIAEVVKPSVVNISTKKKISYNKRRRKYFYKNHYNQKPGKFYHHFRKRYPMPRKFKTTSLGSGVIMSPDGYILTNNHVVRGAVEINVTMNNGKRYLGKVIASDAKTDLAVIKIEAKNLPAIVVGNSDKLKVGEMVIAIGNPYGFNQSVTLGIVSGMGRFNIGIADYEDFIQTDAAINPGNSGGAMINVRGELVGINTAIFSSTGGNQGIGFAIPSNMAISIMESLIKNGKVVRGWLGIQIQDLTTTLGKHFGIIEDSGVIVVNVFEKSPAKKAGFLRGDLIIKFSKKPVQNTRQLKNMAAALEPGTKTEVEILRNKSKKILTITIGEFPEKRYGKTPEFSTNLSGINIQNLDRIIKRKLSIPEKVTGIIVTYIDAKSPAFSILRRNDIILEINRQKINNIFKFKKVLSSLSKKDDTLVLVYRPNQSRRLARYIYLTIPFKK